MITKVFSKPFYVLECMKYDFNAIDSGVSDFCAQINDNMVDIEDDGYYCTNLRESPYG